MRSISMIACSAIPSADLQIKFELTSREEQAPHPAMNGHQDTRSTANAV